MWKVTVTILIGLVAATMCHDRRAVAQRSDDSAAPRIDKGVYEGRTYKNASIGIELTLPPALRFGFPELRESPSRLVSVTAWDPYAPLRQGIIFSASVLSYYPIELRSTENRMRSLVHDLQHVGFEPIEGSTESNLGAVKFARTDFEKVPDTDRPIPSYETIFVRACSDQELVFIVYGPDRNSVKKLVTETELKLDLSISSCGSRGDDLPKR